jgi:CheY-like chemotaxis protein
MNTLRKSKVLAPAIIQPGGSSLQLLQTMERLFTNSLNILYVEDNRCNQELARKIFKNIGWELNIANNGHEALEILLTERFDIIFMDLEMPVMNGFETTVAIREKLCLNIPIIALSTLDAPSDIESCLKVGMNDHIAKPFREIELLSTVLEWTTRD